MANDHSLQASQIPVIPPIGGHDNVWDALNAGGGGGGGLVTLSLYYGAQGPFDFQCWGIPGDWASGTGSIGSQIKVGTNIGSGLLLQENGSPIPDGWTFPAILFVEGTTIYDIVAFNPYTFGTGGMLSWGSSGGVPGALHLTPTAFSLKTDDAVNTISISTTAYTLLLLNLFDGTDANGGFASSVSASDNAFTSMTAQNNNNNIVAQVVAYISRGARPRFSSPSTPLTSPRSEPRPSCSRRLRFPTPTRMWSARSTKPAMSPA